MEANTKIQTDLQLISTQDVFYSNEGKDDEESSQHVEA